MNLSPDNFFDLKGNPLAHIFDGCEYVWDGLKNIKTFLKENLSPNIAQIAKSGPVVEKTVVLYKGKIISSGFSIHFPKSTGGIMDVSINGSRAAGASVIYAGAVLFDDMIYIGKGTVVEPGALIKGPAIIGDDSEVRQGAYIRGDVIAGCGCVIGHTTEVKHSVLLGKSKAGHFAYIGDSILGSVNLGAGTKLANLKIVESSVTLSIDGRKYDTGLRKFGAILGDGVETGCNSVTMPGTIIGKSSVVYPGAALRGYYPDNSIIKLRQKIEIIQKRD